MAYITAQQLSEQLGKIKRVFFYRVCGTGMGAAATLLKQKGFHVEGGDNRFEPPMSDYLKSTGIPLRQLEGIDHSFLQGFDLIVVGNVVPKDSEDARLIETCGVPYCSFPAAMGAAVLKDMNVVGIAGTHGKTTTTYLATQIFEKLGRAPGYFIGGVIPGRPSSLLGEGKYFFIESDEYDSSYFEKISKFRFYELDHLILTSLEFDHGDIFHSIQDIKDQFLPVLNGLTGSLIYDETYPELQDCLKQRTSKNNHREASYGGPMTGPRMIEAGPQGSLFELVYGGVKRQFKTNLVGRHNILNLSACLLFCDHEGISYDELAPVLTQLDLVKRRQEVKGHWGEAIVIDDFAHHPRAVQLTLEGLKLKYPERHLIVVFEPHSATARSDFYQAEFTEAFRVCTRLMITRPTRPTSLKNAKDLNLEKMKQDLERQGVPVSIVDNLNQIVSGLEEYKTKKDLIVILSNGTCLGFWEANLVAKNT